MLLPPFDEEWNIGISDIRHAIYTFTFKSDRNDVVNSTRRSGYVSDLFHSIFFKSDSYLSRGENQPLDICEIVLGRTDRLSRSAFFKFLTGSCKIFFADFCPHCSFEKQPRAPHFVFSCPRFSLQRSILFAKVRKILENHNRPLLKIFDRAVISDKKRASKILFGGNSWDEKLKEVYRIPRQSREPQDSISVATSRFCKHVINACSD